MPNSLFLFIYTFTYFQIDSIIKPFLLQNFTYFDIEPFIYYPVIKSANIFTLTIFLSLNVYLIFFRKYKNYTIFSLLLIYIKYLFDLIIYHNEISVFENSFKRSIMWCFTTPLILKLYSNINNVSLININAQYHIASNIIYIIIYPFNKNLFIKYIIVILSFVEGYFIYKLYFFKKYKFTQFVIYMWFLFTILHIIDFFNILNQHDIHICYLLSDMLAKLTTILFMHDNEEYIYNTRINIDLQTITLLSNIKKCIKQFETSNSITEKCSFLINEINNNLVNYIPNDKTPLKLELLKKILPFQFEEQYLTQSNDYKEYKSICVLFTYIVSYTELAKKYDSTIIYKLLNEIYTRFDNIVNRYSNLQKIETIGDAYMVVGNIYENTELYSTNNNNEIQNRENNIKNIILISIDFLKEIKLIDTPDHKPLQLRIGINIGKVVIGILGSEIPRLCVIGNTVNVAARLQSTAEPDTIQLSRHIYEISKDIDFGFDINYQIKENIFLKNIGSVTTYNINL